jgi:hypothetical protein
MSGLREGEAMNLQQRRRQKLLAARLAEYLFERTKNEDWQTRLVAYGVTLGDIARRFTGVKADELIPEFATAVVKAFGSPPISCAEQLPIWGSSYEYQDEAKAWLVAQGGTAVVDRGDGEQCVMHEVNGLLAFTPLPSAGEVMH